MLIKKKPNSTKGKKQMPFAFFRIRFETQAQWKLDCSECLPNDSYF